MIPNRLAFHSLVGAEEKREAGASPASKSLGLLFNTQLKRASAATADDARWQNVPERETRPADAEEGW